MVRVEWWWAARHRRGILWMVCQPAVSRVLGGSWSLVGRSLLVGLPAVDKVSEDIWIFIGSNMFLKELEEFIIVLGMADMDKFPEFFVGGNIMVAHGLGVVIGWGAGVGIRHVGVGRGL